MEPINFADKTPERAASILKQQANGIKRNAEMRIWPLINRAKQAEDAGTVAYFTAVILALLENREEPKVKTADAQNRPSTELAAL